RLELSIKNNWIDSDNAIYFIYTNEKLEEILNLSKPTIIKIKKELVNTGLLEQKRRGLNKPNLLYLMKPDITENDIYEIQQSENDEESSSIKEVKNFNFQKLNNFTTRSKESLLLDIKNFNSNDTDINDTDINDTDINDLDGMSGNNNVSNTETHNHSDHSNHVNDNYLIDEQTYLLKPMPEELKQFIKSRYTLADSISIINKIIQAKKAAGDRRNDVPFFYFEQNEELSDKIIEILIAVNREMKKKRESVQSMLAYYYNALVNGLEEFHFTMQAREAMRDKNSFLDL